MSGINVLLIVGSRVSSVSGTLAELAGESSPDGIRVSVFDSLDELPLFSETAATVELPGSVDALRNAAAAADAVLLVTFAVSVSFCRFPSRVSKVGVGLKETVFTAPNNAPEDRIPAIGGSGHVEAETAQDALDVAVGDAGPEHRRQAGAAEVQPLRLNDRRVSVDDRRDGPAVEHARRLFGKHARSAELCREQSARLEGEVANDLRLNAQAALPREQSVPGIDRFQFGPLPRALP